MYINNVALINNLTHFSQLYHNEGENCVSYGKNNKLLYQFAIYITRVLHAKRIYSYNNGFFFFTLIRLTMQTHRSILSSIKALFKMSN